MQEGDYQDTTVTKSDNHCLVFCFFKRSTTFADISLSAFHLSAQKKRVNGKSASQKDGRLFWEPQKTSQKEK